MEKMHRDDDESSRISFNMQTPYQLNALHAEMAIVHASTKRFLFIRFSIVEVPN